MTNEKELKIPAGGGAPSLAERLHSIMSECDHIAKNGRNESQGYDYVTESDVSHAIRKLLIKHKVLCLPSLESHSMDRYTTSKGTVTNYVTCIVAYNFINVDNPSEAYVMKQVGSGTDSGDKAVFKALTGLHKYMLLRAFCLPTGDDPEVDNEDEKKQEPKKVAAKVDVKPSKVSQLIAEGKRQELGEHAMITKCQMQHMKVKDIFSENSNWIITVLADAAKRDKLATDDRNALIHYSKYMEEHDK